MVGIVVLVDKLQPGFNVNQAACKGYGLTGGTPTNYNQTMNPEPTKPITIANYRFAEFAQED